MEIKNKIDKSFVYKTYQTPLPEIRDFKNSKTKNTLGMLNLNE